MDRERWRHIKQESQVSNLRPCKRFRMKGGQVGLELIKDVEGPMAMTYDMELGWVMEVLGPTSGHWKRKAREGQTKGKDKVLA